MRHKIYKYIRQFWIKNTSIDLHLGHRIKKDKIVYKMFYMNLPFTPGSKADGSCWKILTCTDLFPPNFKWRFLRRMTWIESEHLREIMGNPMNRINVKIIGFVYKSFSKLKLIKYVIKSQRIYFKKRRNGERWIEWRAH